MATPLNDAGSQEEMTLDPRRSGVLGVYLREIVADPFFYAFTRSSTPVSRHVGSRENVETAFRRCQFRGANVLYTSTV